MTHCTAYGLQTQREKLISQAYIGPSVPMQWHFLAVGTDQQMAVPVQ